MFIQTRIVRISSETEPEGAELTFLSPHFHLRAGLRLLLAVALLVWPLTANAEQTVPHGFAVRNQNPFLQIFGLPAFQSATLMTEGVTKAGLSFDLVNHADDGDNTLEDFVVDGESYFLTLSLRRGITKRLELGVDLPLVAHAEGFLDNAIEGWHDLLGLSNSKRDGVSNQLGFRYVNADSVQYELRSPAFGLGDIQISAAIPLRRADDSSDKCLALRSAIKLPTGAADELRGSGAADFSLGIYFSDTRLLRERKLDMSGFVGALLLGDGDVLAEIQRSAVPYGGAAATWYATDRLRVSTQVYAQGAYFDSDLEELGGTSVQLAVGGAYRLAGRGLLLSLAIVEDLVANATPDFAVHFSVRWIDGR